MELPATIPVFGGPGGCRTLSGGAPTAVPHNGTPFLDRPSPMSLSPASPLVVGLAQMKPRKGDVRANLDKIGAVIADAGGDHDLLVFPETCLTGYFLKGAVAELAFGADEVADMLGRAPKGGPDLVLGFYERHRRRIHNSAVYFSAREGRYQPLRVHRKMFLPTYGLFDEGRFVEPGRDLRAFDTPWGRMGHAGLRGHLALVGTGRVGSRRRGDPRRAKRVSGAGVPSGKRPPRQRRALGPAPRGSGHGTRRLRPGQPAGGVGGRQTVRGRIGGGRSRRRHPGPRPALRGGRVHRRSRPRRHRPPPFRFTVAFRFGAAAPQSARGAGPGGSRTPAGGARPRFGG